MNPLIESLEVRQVLSAPLALPLADLSARLFDAQVTAPQFHADSAPRARRLNVVGAYTGRATDAQTGERIRVTLSITEQDRRGNLKGRLRSPVEDDLRYSLTGTLKTDRSVTLTLKGRDPDGQRSSITVTGRFGKKGNTFAGNYSGRTGDDRFSGTLKLSEVT